MLALFPRIFGEPLRHQLLELRPLARLHVLGLRREVAALVRIGELLADGLRDAEGRVTRGRGEHRTSLGLGDGWVGGDLHVVCYFPPRLYLLRIRQSWNVFID